MKYKLTVLIIILGMIMPGVFVTHASAAEILTEEDFRQNIIREEQLVRLADNFIVMFDASSSKKEPYSKDPSVTKYDISRKILKERNALHPDLGYNGGLYLFTPYKEVYAMQPYDRQKFTQAIDTLPAEPEFPTMLQDGLLKMDSVLQGVSGKTVVFLFSDGTYTEVAHPEKPEEIAKRLADKYNVCFYVISSATTRAAEKLVQDIASVNECSRVVPFTAFIDNPEYTTGALYTVKSIERVETITETKIVGIKIENILFNYDVAEPRVEFQSEMDELGEFLKSRANAYAVLTGYTDSTGSDEYNLGLSRRRAESVAGYLRSNFNIDPSRIVMNWYGKANPIASNDTDEGRSMNRRVEVAVALSE